MKIFESQRECFGGNFFSTIEDFLHHVSKNENINVATDPKQGCSKTYSVSPSGAYDAQDVVVRVVEAKKSRPPPRV